tara:strand:- start:390 stop:2471 length:2082 start_codon:yes stop_codon:yes gene_type:complete
MNNNAPGINLGIEEDFEPQKRDVTKEYGEISNLKTQVMNKAKETADKCQRLAEQYKGFLAENKQLAQSLAETTEVLRACLKKLGLVEQDYDEVMVKIKTIKDNSDSRMKQIEQQGETDKQENQKKREELEKEYERKKQEDSQRLEEEQKERDEQNKRLVEEQKQEEQRVSEQQQKEKEDSLAQAKREAEENARLAKEKFEEEKTNASQECKDKLEKMQQEMNKLVEDHKVKLQEQHDTDTGLLTEKQQMFDKNKKELEENFNKQIKELNDKNKEQSALEQNKLKVVDELKLKQANDKCEKEKQVLLNEILTVLKNIQGIEVAADDGAKLKITEIKDVVEKTCDKINSLEQKVKASSVNTRNVQQSPDNESKGDNNTPDLPAAPADFILEAPLPSQGDVANLNGKELWYTGDFRGFQHWYQLFGNAGSPADLSKLGGNPKGPKPYARNSDFALYSKKFTENIMNYRTKQPGYKSAFRDRLFKAWDLMVKIAKEENPSANPPPPSTEWPGWLEVSRKLRRWLAHFYNDYIEKNKEMPTPEDYRHWLYNLYINGTFKGSSQNIMSGGNRGGMKSIAEVEKNIVMKKCSHPNSKSNCHNPVAQESKAQCSSFGYNSSTNGSDCKWIDPKARVDPRTMGGKKKKKQKGGYRYGVKLNMKRTLKTREKTQRLKTFKKKRKRRKRSRKRKKLKMSKKKRR